MADVKNYDSKKVSVIVGSRALKGFAEDSRVSVARDEPVFNAKVGGDGEVTRSKTNNRLGTITVSLDQSSESNDYLSGLLQADEKSGNGLFPVLVRDAGGSSLAGGPKAWIEAFPEMANAKDAGDREWIIKVGDLEMFVGGN